MTAIEYPTFINGRRSDRVAIADRAIAYGDGLFETMKVYRRSIPLLSYHLKRLQRGFSVLGFLDIKQELIKQELELAIAEMPVDCGVLKLIVSRGCGRGYRPPIEPDYQRIIQSSALPDCTLESLGINVFLCRTRLPEAFELAGLKHLNRLPQVMARREWQPGVFVEGLMQNAQGEVVEATQSNLFWLISGCLYTDELKSSGVAGVARELLIKEIAPSLGIKVCFSQASYQELLMADGLFICNSLMGVIPVTGAAQHGQDDIVAMTQKGALELVHRLQRAFEVYCQR